MTKPSNTNNITSEPISFYIFLALTFILVGRPQDFLFFLRSFRLAFLFTLLAFIFTFISKPNSFREIFEINESKKYLFFYFIMIIGIPFALHRGIAFNYVFKIYLSNMLFFCIFVVQVDSIKKLKKVLFTLCLSVFFYSIFTLATGSFFHGIDAFGELQDRRFAAGSMFDPNDIAYFFVSMLPLVSYFVLRNEALYKKIIAAISIVVSLYVILLSGSRGGFLGLATIFILITFTKLSGLKVSHKIILVVCLIIGFACYGHKIDMDRYLSMTNMKDDYNVTDEYGRLGMWERGFQMTLSHPITGVGIDCFSMAIGYARDADGEIPRWQAVHSSYVQVAAEIGLIGFSVFILIIIKCLKNFAHFKEVNTTNYELLQLNSISRLVLLGFIGHLVCAFFLTQAYSVLFTLFFALSAVVKTLYSNLEDSS